MSRTSIHRPYWVLFFDDPRLVRECHDHGSGQCDLPTLAAWAAAVREGSPPAGARWNCSYELDWRKVPCGCRMCTGRDFRRQTRRRDRHIARAQYRYGKADD